MPKFRVYETYLVTRVAKRSYEIEAETAEEAQEGAENNEYEGCDEDYMGDTEYGESQWATLPADTPEAAGWNLSANQLETDLAFQWCEPCKSYHAAPMNEEHHRELQCKAPFESHHHHATELNA